MAFFLNKYSQSFLFVAVDIFTVLINQVWLNSSCEMSACHLTLSELFPASRVLLSKLCEQLNSDQASQKSGLKYIQAVRHFWYP